MRTDTKQQYEYWLNQCDVPDSDRKSEGGLIPDGAKYGSWIRRNDPIAFQVGYREWASENRSLASRF